MALKQTDGRAKFGPHETWYRVTGDLASGKPPVFILHGGPGAAHNYVDSYKLLSETGRAVIHYDQLGCGLSTHLPDADKSFWTPQLFVDELENLVDHLGQRNAFHVLGQSWGGMLAELMAGSIDTSPALRDSDRQALIRQAMAATTKQLDRNSRYADPEEARDNRFQRDGGGGIGITVERTDDKKIIIRAIQDGSPAGKAGVQVGDQILAIDGENMVDRPLGDVVRYLRGTIGTPVVLTVLRPSQGREVTVGMKRSRIVPTTVVYERRGDVGLIVLSGFNTATTDNLRTAIDKARTEIGRDIAGLIIDMRGNRGGLLDQAQAVAEVFIGDGTIFSTQGRHPDSRRTYKSTAARKAADLPVVVLMNGGSASAAEIVAAALQDRGRAVVVGTTSYGKGTVQTVVRLPNEGELILTWSRLQAPSGYTWNELGVLPSICTAKTGTAGEAATTSSVDSNQASLMRWHALRNPTQQEVADLRKICPPADNSPERDIEIASQLLHDRALYAHAVQAATFQAARP